MMGVKAVLMRGKGKGEEVVIINFVSGTVEQLRGSEHRTVDEPIAVYYGKDGLVKHSYIYNTADEPVFKVVE